MKFPTTNGEKFDDRGLLEHFINWGFAVKKISFWKKFNLWASVEGFGPGMVVMTAAGTVVQTLLPPHTFPLPLPFPAFSGPPLIISLGQRRWLIQSHGLEGKDKWVSVRIIFNNPPDFPGWSLIKRSSRSCTVTNTVLFSTGEAGCSNKADAPRLPVWFETRRPFSIQV